MINENFILLGVALQLIGGLGYLIDTLKGKVKPNKVSWLLWSLAPLIAFFAEIKQGVGILSLTTFVAGFVPFLIFIASFMNKKAEWKLYTFDLVCGALSILGLVFWMVTKVGNIAIFFSILADALASVPTVVKAYKQPETENGLVFFMSLFNSGIGLLVIKTWNFQHVGFPLYLLINAIIFVAIIYGKLGKRRFFPKKNRA